MRVEYAVRIMKAFFGIFLLVLAFFAIMEFVERVWAPLPAPGGGWDSARQTFGDGGSVPATPVPSSEALQPSPAPQPAAAPAASPTPRPTAPGGPGAKLPKQVKPIPQPITEVTVPVSPPATPVPTPPPPSDAELYARISGAVVQIFCASADRLYSASGIIVNRNGLVLTNAHVAEIVKSVGEQNCKARHGNPAEEFSGVRNVYTADTGPKIAGTTVAQRDFAFLQLDAPREQFDSAAVAVLLAAEGSSLYTLGYPSEFLQNIAAFNNSNLVFSVLRIDNYADLDGDLATVEGYLSKGGLALQQGSSGTALFDREGRVLGIIFATTKGATTAEREGVALSMPYLDRVMKLETGEGLMEFIAGH